MSTRNLGRLLVLAAGVLADGATAIKNGEKLRKYKHQKTRVKPLLKIKEKRLINGKWTREWKDMEVAPVIPPLGVVVASPSEASATAELARLNPAPRKYHYPLPPKKEE